jgi:hypothetical protein
MGWFKQGDIFLSTSQSKNVSHHTLFQYDGASHALLGSFGEGVAGLGEGAQGAWLSPNGDLWILNWNGSIKAVKPDGTARWTSSATQPESAVFDQLGYGWIGSQSGGQVDQFQFDGTRLSTFTPAAEGRGVDHVELHEDGHTLLYTSESTHVLRWDLKSHLQGTAFATLGAGAIYAYGIRRVPVDGSYLVCVVDATATGRVDRLNVNGVLMQSYTVPSAYEGPYGIDMEANNTHFWVGVRHQTTDISTAVRFALAGGATGEAISTGVVARAVDGLSVNIMKLRSPMLKVY